MAAVRWTVATNLAFGAEKRVQQGKPKRNHTVWCGFFCFLYRFYTKEGEGWNECMIEYFGAINDRPYIYSLKKSEKSKLLGSCSSDSMLPLGEAVKKL